MIEQISFGQCEFDRMPGWVQCNLRRWVNELQDIGSAMTTAKTRLGNRYAVEVAEKYADKVDELQGYVADWREKARKAAYNDEAIIEWLGGIPEVVKLARPWADSANDDWNAPLRTA